jgi:hypothetical protein
MTNLRTEVAEYLQKRDDTMLINMPIEIYLGRAEIIIALINKRWQDWLKLCGLEIADDIANCSYLREGGTMGGECFYPVNDEFDDPNRFCPGHNGD